MNTIVKTATGVFIGISVFALVVFFIYSEQKKKEEEQAMARQAAIEEATEEYEKAIDSLIAEIEPVTWVETEEIDPITRQVTRVVGRLANADDPANAPSLHIRCKNNRTQLFVNWRTYVGTAARVVSRIDDQIIGERGWEVSTDNTTTFYPESPIPTIKRLIESDRYAIRARNMSGDEFTAVFELEGISDAVTSIRELCNW